MEYKEFIKNKQHTYNNYGFEPIFMPNFLFDFQKELVAWSIKKGRSAIFADCGLGKTPMQLVWSQNIVEKTNKPVLILTPLSVSQQTIREGEKFNIDCERSINGKFKGKKIIVTNYERLHYFNPDDFAGVVCDESSCIKNFEGKRQSQVINFLKKHSYRLLCTATAAPNDFIELGTSSEALGELGRMDMLSTFFKNNENSLNPIWWGARWGFKAHAEKQFWRWVVSWARAIRKPSDLGFNDEKFELPKLIENEHVIKTTIIPNGQLFPIKAVTLQEQRNERRNTLKDRCEYIIKLVKNHRCSVIWCHLNSEADYLEKIVPNSCQVSGKDNDEKKEEKFLMFLNGDIKRLIIKPKIGAFGLNWQHCNHETFFPSHSFEQYYQGVRRCWRFGQKNNVTIDMITSEGELGVLKNLQRKTKQANKMFSMLVKYMNNAININNDYFTNTKCIFPEWLRSE